MTQDLHFALGFLDNKRNESGWPTDDYAMVLYSLVKALRPDIVVEIGTYKGFATCHMAKALIELEKGEMHTFDKKQHLDFEDLPVDFKNRISYYPDAGSGSVKFTDIISKLGAIGFAFIDGGHSYERCIADFNILWPLMNNKGGIIALHDSDKAGVAQAVEDIRQAHNGIIELPSFGGMTLVQVGLHNKAENLKYWEIV